MNLKLHAWRLGGSTEYPALGIMGAILILAVSPFVSNYLCYGVLLICIYRMIRYDAAVFTTDYFFLMPMSPLFRTSGGMSLLIWLCLVAAIWFSVRGKLKGTGALVCVILLLNYLLVRMQSNISGFALCFGQMFMLMVLLPYQTSETAERAMRLFCWSLLASSIYALVFRTAPQIVSIRGPEVPAYAGSVFRRFSGIFGDPNYYTTLLLTGIAVLVKLRECKKIGVGQWVAMSASFAFLGILTFSKAFLLVFALLILFYIVWQFRNGKWMLASVLTIATILVGAIVFYANGAIVSAVIYRLLSANTFSELTTGRSDIYVEYWSVITESIGNFLLGLGLAAPMLSKETHNLYLEILYTTGLIGLVLIAAYYWSIMKLASSRATNKRSFFSKYYVLLIVLVVYFSLHGMTSMVFYTCMFLALIAMRLEEKKEVQRV